MHIHTHKLVNEKVDCHLQQHKQYAFFFFSLVSSLLIRIFIFLFLLHPFFFFLYFSRDFFFVSKTGWCEWSRVIHFFSLFFAQRIDSLAGWLSGGRRKEIIFICKSKSNRENERKKKKKVWDRERKNNKRHNGRMLRGWIVRNHARNVKEKRKEEKHIRILCMSFNIHAYREKQTSNTLSSGSISPEYPNNWQSKNAQHNTWSNRWEKRDSKEDKKEMIEDSTQRSQTLLMIHEKYIQP